MRPRADLPAVRRELLEGMREFLEPIDGEPSPDPPYYRLEDVDRCDAILAAFVERVAGTRGETSAVHALVQETVEALNRLNDSTDGALIETEQRELLWEFVQGSVEAVGYRGEADVTGAWRDW